MTKKDEGCQVRLIRPGAIACGDYVAGKVYTVTKDQAKRLVNVKGFEHVKQEK